jgi:hypothetical protein
MGLVSHLRHLRLRRSARVLQRVGREVLRDGQRWQRL